MVALGMKKTLEHVEDPLALVPAAGALGGTALYLLAHVAFRWRNVHRFSNQRLLCAIGLLVLVPAALEIPALATLAVVAVVLGDRPALFRPVLEAELAGGEDVRPGPKVAVGDLEAALVEKAAEIGKVLAVART